MGGGEVVQMLLDGEVVVEYRDLRAVAQRSVQLDPPPVRGQGAGEDLQQGRLAGPVLTDHGRQFAGTDAEVDASQHVVPAVGLVHIVGFENGSPRVGHPDPSPRGGVSGLGNRPVE